MNNTIITAMVMVKDAPQPTIIPYVQYQRLSIILFILFPFWPYTVNLPMFGSADISIL